MQDVNTRMERFFSTLWPAEEKVLVFGEGRRDHPHVMLIGEAPGEQETLQRRPFVGKAGRNLDSFLEAVRLARSEIYITNVVKIRPTRVSEKGTVSNRPPSREELALFIPYLYEEIEAVSPALIVTLGNTALRALLGGEASIGVCHGKAQTAAIGRTEYTVFPLYHPASIIYNRALMPVYEEDLRRLGALLQSGV